MLQQARPKYLAFAPIHISEWQWPNVCLTRAPNGCSVDLRDGNQALIEPIDSDCKLRMFKTLVRMGFKKIEVRFPAEPQTDFDFIRLLIECKFMPRDVTIQVLTQARDSLIERSFEWSIGARRVVIHLYNAASAPTRRVVLGLSEDQTIALATLHAHLIKHLGFIQPHSDFRFEYSPEMFSGTALNFSKRVVNAVTQTWLPTSQQPYIINSRSTAEDCSPYICADLIEWMHWNIARIDAVILLVHPHSERGTSAAAVDLALMAGTDCVEGCLFGNCERTGNADLVNLAFNLHTPRIAPRLYLSDIDEVRRFVVRCNQLAVHPRHPCAGDLVYTSFYGSHQDAINKAFAARKECEICDLSGSPIYPRNVGRTYDALIRVNIQSGKGGIAYLPEKEDDIELLRRLQIEFSQVVETALDDSGKEMTAAELWPIFQAEYRTSSATLTGFRTQELSGGLIQLQVDINLGEASVAHRRAGRSTRQRRRMRPQSPPHSAGSGARLARARCGQRCRFPGSGLFGVACRRCVEAVRRRYAADIGSTSLKAIVSGVERARCRRTENEPTVVFAAS